jgi:hypothetical protein
MTGSDVIVAFPAAEACSGLAGQLVGLVGGRHDIDTRQLAVVPLT